MCLLVTKVSIKSFTIERPLEYLSPNIPMLINKVSRYILVLICLLIVTEAKLAWLKQPWSFSSEKQQGAASDKVFPNIAVSEI